jgi:hypothetical protein
MDVFALGCVIAELFLDGAALFDLSSLLRYRASPFLEKERSYADVLGKVKDEAVEQLVRHMIAFDAEKRMQPSQHRWDNLGDGKLFPSYFEHFLFDFVSKIQQGDMNSCDARIAYVCANYSDILKHLAGVVDQEGEEFFRQRVSELQETALAPKEMCSSGHVSGSADGASKVGFAPDSNLTPNDATSSVRAGTGDMSEESYTRNLLHKSKHFLSMLKHKKTDSVYMPAVTPPPSRPSSYPAIPPGLLGSEYTSDMSNLIATCEIFENSRFQPYQGWEGDSLAYSSAFLSTGDPPRFSDITGVSALSSSMFTDMKAPDGWTWVDEVARASLPMQAAPLPPSGRPVETASGESNLDSGAKDHHHHEELVVNGGWKVDLHWGACDEHGWVYAVDFKQLASHSYGEEYQGVLDENQDTTQKPSASMGMMMMGREEALSSCSPKMRDRILCCRRRRWVRNRVADGLLESSAHNGYYLPQSMASTMHSLTSSSGAVERKDPPPPPPPPPLTRAADADNGLPMVVTLVCASLRGTATPQTRLIALALLERLAMWTSDDIRLQRVVPYLVVVLDDKRPLVQSRALHALTAVLGMVQSFPKSEIGLFPRYIIPALTKFPKDPDENVRGALAECLPHLAHTARFFLELEHAKGPEGAILKNRKAAELKKPGGGGGVEREERDDSFETLQLQQKYSGGSSGKETRSSDGGNNALETSILSDEVVGWSKQPRARDRLNRGESVVLELPKSEERVMIPGNFDQSLSALNKLWEGLIGPVIQESMQKSCSLTKEALLHGVTKLCVSMGEEQTLNFILPQLITFLNDRDWQVRAAFYNHISGVCNFIGRKATELNLLPCLMASIKDTEEGVIVAAVGCMSKLCSFDTFFTTRMMVEKAKEFIPLVLHPSYSIRSSCVQLLSVVAKALGSPDVYAFLLPILQPFLREDFPQSLLPHTQNGTAPFTPSNLLKSIIPPLPRRIFDAAIMGEAEEAKNLTTEQIDLKKMELMKVHLRFMCLFSICVFFISQMFN